MIFFQIFLKTASQRAEEKRAVEKAYEILEMLEIKDTANEIAGSLPYGTQRKVEIARALASEPRMLLLDEPTAGMNPQETDDLMYLIDEIRKTGPAIVVIEHSFAECEFFRSIDRIGCCCIDVRISTLHKL